MAVQSEIFSTEYGVRSFISTKHIATKQHMSVWLQRRSDNIWVQLSTSNYELINNSAVLTQAPNSITYSKVEIRVADTPDELGSSQSEIAVLAGLYDEIVALNGIKNDITTVAGNTTNVTTVSNNIVNINSVATNIVPNLAEILQADTNATIATTKASEASASATSASNSATTATNQATIATAQAGIATTQADIATTKASEAATHASNALTSEHNAIAAAQAAGVSADEVGTWTIAAPFSVATIGDLSTIDINKYNTAIVKDLNRGGTFIWSATGTANGGTVFAGATGYWNRQYSGAVNVKWFTDAQLAFSLGVEVDCTGVTLTPSVPYTVANNTTVKNGTFEAHLIDNSSYGKGVFNLISNNNIIFDGCTFKGYANINTSKNAHGISIDGNGGSGSNFIEIKHCIFDGISGSGIASNVVTGAFAHNWNIHNNTFKLYGINNIYAGVMSGIDLFSNQDISSQYIYDIYVHDNSFNITAGYEGVAYKIQGCVQSYVYNNVVYGGNVIDYSSSLVELYMKGHFYNNVISASANIRSISIVGSNDLRVSNCSFINGINTYVNSRAGGINNLNITIENCNISGTSAGVSNGTNLKFKNCAIGAISVSNIVGIEFKDCSISSFIWGASNSSSLVINKCRINSYIDAQTSFKSVSNSELSVSPGSYNMVSLYNGMYINNTFYGQEGAIAGAYCVKANTGTVLVNNKYTYYNINGNAKGSYSGYIAVDGEALKGSVTVRESIESFLSGVSTYTVYDVNSKGNIYVSDLTPSAGTFFTGDRIYDTTPSAGGYYGWVCTSGGTFGTLSGITASTTSGSATIVVNSTAGLWGEMFISIAGVTGTKRIKSISGTSVTLYSTCDASVTSASVAYVTPVLKTFGAITA